MIILKVVQAVMWLLVIPYLLGKFLENKEKNEILYTWLVGHVLLMGIFLVTAVPMILMRANFQSLRNLYFVIIVVFTTISFLIHRNNLIKISKPKSISIFQVIAILLVGMQIFIRFHYTTINNDDASFVVLSAQMIEDGDMYHYGEGTNLNARRALAPISAYYAVISEYLFTHVTIVTHIVYYYLGKSLFKQDKDAPYIFLILMILANFYFFRFKGAGAYLLKFTWLGRVIVTAVFIPLLWKVSLDAMNKEKNHLKDWLTIFLIVLAACLCSEMSIAIVSIPVMVLGMIGAIRDKKPSYLLKSLGTIIPCLLLAIIYINIR